MLNVEMSLRILKPQLQRILWYSNCSWERCSAIWPLTFRNPSEPELNEHMTVLTPLGLSGQGLRRLSLIWQFLSSFHSNLFLCQLHCFSRLFVLQIPAESSIESYFIGRVSFRYQGELRDPPTRTLVTYNL